MESMLIGIAGRVVERIVVVVFGGLAVYWGYRLFLSLPAQQGGDGKLQLPGIRLVLAKAAPGTFFVAFGVVLLATSFLSPVRFEGPSGEYTGMVETSSPSGDLTQRRARAELAIQTLNCMQRSFDNGRGGLTKEDVEVAATDAKLALLRSVWDGGAWGDYGAFERWARQRAGSVPKPVQRLYEGSSPACRGR